MPQPHSHHHGVLSTIATLGLALAASAFAASAAQAQAFTLGSPDFSEGSTLPQRFEFKGFGCAGDNQSPALRWSGAPAGTQSYAVTVYDPDAPTGSGWWHWTVVNIPASVTALPPGAGAAGNALLPAGASQVRIDYGVAAWGGTCPPEGDAPHRYIFTVHALKVPRLDLPADATAALAGYMVHAHSLGKATLTARYGRPAAKALPQ
ncbi:YbhB/YbcL family Raf kinase inhibitor-like protein [Simplicispira lacusdiani]|uniref:YbhB/YbcL family Raf kinase inhibitor-like protein n=1 Tax=Simplicispira lacusdiani TaxID=2213010 RepID=UPI000E728788|nr:YbhB/YbcL family Raf kinase inhibitor-like protein [Simplicispira lacusdiani]